MKAHNIDWVSPGLEDSEYFHLTETYDSKENPRVLEYESLPALLDGEGLELGTIKVVNDPIYYWAKGSNKWEMAKRIVLFTPPTFVWTVHELPDSDGLSDETIISTTSESSIAPACQDEREAFTIHA